MAPDDFTMLLSKKIRSAPQSIILEVLEVHSVDDSV